MPGSKHGRPFVVALTGGIASGKSAVSTRFGALGVPVVDTDVIARTLVRPGQPALAAIVNEFGCEVLGPEGQLNRKRMRNIIFSEPASRKRLEAILHPAIRAEAKRQVFSLNAPYCILVVPLLTVTGRYRWSDRILVIDVDEETQIARVMARDQISRRQAEAILESQPGRRQRLAFADDVIENSGSLQDLDHAVSSLHRQYVELSRTDAQRNGA